MTTRLKLLATAMAIAVGVSSVFAETTTNTWWTVDFDTGGYTNGGLITNNASQANGAWTSTGDDTSIMTNDTVASYTDNMGKIDTQGGTLVWTPIQNDKPAGSTKVLLDAKVYMVGSEDVPSASTGTVQTEVFLTNDVPNTTSYLCAHVGGTSGDEWVQLSGVTITDQSWVDLRIEIDYDPATPQVAFYVNDIRMTSGGAEWFDVMTAGASQETVTDVTFMGTGYLDNFVGQGVAPAGPSFSDGGESTDGDDGTGSAVSIVETNDVVTATFTTGTEYIQMTGPDGFVQTARVSDGVASFSTLDLPAGTYSITAYYGAAPTVVPTGYKPEAEATGSNKAAEVVEDGGGKKIAINVAPVSGLYYTLFAGPDLNSLTAGGDSVLASPDDEDNGYLQISMPVPTQANEVKVIKIYASDDSY